MYQFTEDCRIGVEQIDKEHEQLFEIINSTMKLLEQDNAGRKEVINVFRKLNDYAVIHFAHEEEYMMQINDPELEHQKKMHQEFVAKLKELEQGDIRTGDDKETVKKVLDFLSRWLFRHILGSDTMIGVFRKEEQKKEEKKDIFAFTEEYRIGVALIDEEHEELFAIIRRANDLITANLLHDKYDEIVSVLDELRDYTVKHFTDEETYMESIGYEGLEIQKQTHEIFVNKLNDIDLDDLDNNQQQYLIELVDFLLMWLINHILKMDKKIPCR